MSWNSQPPRGGPMVPVRGFPGPLYPPDHPDGPSPDTPLVLALKRTAARCGAWPWTPDDWDDSYSNRFAHGDGWNDDTHAGVEGLQHWSGTLDVTGSVGEPTFNFLRSVRVPQGRTHAGEMAMDSVAAALVDQAYDLAYPPQPRTTVREAALDRLTMELGVKESPAGSNMQMFGEWYGENGVPWCAIAVTWAYELGAQDTGYTVGHPSFQSVKAVGSTNDRHDYVPWIVSDARGGRYGFSVTNTPIPGDLVCFDWEGNGEFDHVGLFEKWTSQEQGAFTSIEANTSPEGSSGSQSNGGEVCRRNRNTRSTSIVFVRVAEPSP